MNHFKTPLMILGFIVLLAGSSLSNTQSPWEITSDKSAQTKLPEKQTAPLDRSEEIHPSEPVKVPQPAPVYKPPLRGSPGGRVAGGSRDITIDTAIALYALAPDHVGLTVNPHPQLYWFISALPPAVIQFALIEADTQLVVLDKRIPPSENSGIQCIFLADHSVYLQEKTRYKWIITLVPDPNRRSRKMLVGGHIERIPAPADLRRNLQKAGPSGAPFLHAQAGLWYDALAAVSDLINKSPQDKALRRARASLMEQIGLKEVAAYDLQ